MKIRRSILTVLLAGILTVGTAVNVMASEVVLVEGTEEGLPTGMETEGEQNAQEGLDNEQPEMTPEEGIEPYSDSGETAPLETGLTKLAAPVNLVWTNNMNMQWQDVPEAMGHYAVEVYKDGELMETMYWSMGQNAGETVQVNYSPYINESGTYKFRVMAKNDYDPATYEESEYSSFSEERYYQRPDTVLGTTVGYWDAGQKGLFHYTTVGGAGGYMICLYKVEEDGSVAYVRGSWSVAEGLSDVAGEVVSRDLTDWITDEGEYLVSVRALSGNLDLIANGPEGEKSNAFDTKESATTVDGVLDAALALGNATAALQTVKEQVDLSTMRTAMQTDDAVLAKMKALEESYALEKGISVSANAAGGAEQYVDANKISMVGAALNTESGAVNLAVTVPEKKIDVDTNRYVNSVQLDLKLWSDNQYKSELTVPITITMPIPAGVEANHLTILHYHNDGNSEVVAPKVNADGTVTFTITSFSTFVFANESENSEEHSHSYYDMVVEPTETNWGYTMHTCECGDVYYDSYVAPLSEAAAAVTSPQTGESAMPDVAAAAAVMAIGGVVLYRKRNRFAR